MRVALAGQGAMGAAVARSILGSRHELVGILVNGRRSRGLRRRLDGALAAARIGSPLLVTARGSRLPVLWLDRLDRDEIEGLRALGADLLLLSNFGIVLNAEILSIPGTGAINTHWSLLPRHRGPAPHTTVILAGEEETGLSFHVVTPRIDAGDILDQVRFPVRPDDTAMRIYAEAARLAAERVVAVLDRVEAEGLRGRPQDLSEGSYHRRLRPEDVEIDWTLPAERIDRLVRACTRPVPWFAHRGGRVYLTRTRYDAEPTGAEPGQVLARKPEVRIAAGSGSVIVEAAYVGHPLPCPWPTPWAKLGEAVAVGPR